MQEREEEGVRLPRRPRGSRVLTEGNRIEEHRDPVAGRNDPVGVKHLAWGCHVHQTGCGDIPERREIVDVRTTFGKLVVANDRDGGRIRVGPVPVDGHAFLVAAEPGSLRHITKDNP